MHNFETPLCGFTPLPASAPLGDAPSSAPARRGGPIRLLSTLVAIVAASLLAAPNADAKGPRCGGGYFAVDGPALASGAATPDAIAIGAGTVSTIDGCPAVRAATFRALKARGGADLLVVRWPSCGAAKRVVVRAMLSPDCKTISGTVRAKGKKRRTFTAREALPSELSEPWDPNALPLPADAVIVNPADFLAASKTPGFRIISPRVLGDDAAAAAADDEANRELIDEFVRMHPDVADRMSIGTDPDDADLQPTGDGNYQLTLRDGDGNATGSVVTMGPVFERAMRAAAIRNFPTRENQLAIYAQRFPLLTEAFGTFPTPEEMASDWSTEDITTLNDWVASQWGEAQAAAPLPGEDLPTSYPAHCGNEIGYDDGTDGSTSGTCSHGGEGLYYTVTWPNKYYDTCIKNQANRGTCVAFAISAGRELQAAKKYNRWINLSEQHLYFSAKTTYQPRMYGDGLNGSQLLQQIFDTNYQQPLESTWDYNPSNSRTGSDATATYMNSCTNYRSGEAAFCSDSAGQGRIQCMQSFGSFICAITSAPTTGITVRSLSGPAELWDVRNPSQSIQSLEYAVHGAQTPVLLSIPVVTSFDGVDKNGFVPYDDATSKVCATKSDGRTCDKKADCQCSRGGHAVLAVGLIYNSKLPERTPRGAGGGYLIVKNSWGCAGDGGYYYLPLAWVYRFVNGARPIGDVVASAPLPDQPFDNYRFEFTPAPPTIHIVQPLVGESYVEGQQVPLVADGADFQYDKYALLGETIWTSDRQGIVATSTSTYVSLIQGTHRLTVRYTGKLGKVVTASTTVVVGRRPANVPPTAYFLGVRLGSGAECETACSFNCVLATGYGLDPEDGQLTSTTQVEWIWRYPDGSTLPAGTGASSTAPKFLGCMRPCGGTFTFTLRVKDSAGQTVDARREIGTPACIN